MAGLIVLGVAALGLRLFEDIRALRSTPRDNVQWTLAQVEVDLLLAASAALTAAETGGVGDIRRRFDIFYSRVELLRRGRVFEDLRREGRVRADLDALRGFLDRTAPLIDGPDPALEARLVDLADELLALREVARRISLEGIEIFARSSDRQRRNFEDLLLLAAGVALTLIVLLAILLAVMLRLYRISLRNADALSQSRERLSATFDASLDAIVVADDQGRILEFNDAAEQVFGYSRAHAVGAPMAELIVPERYREAHEAGMARYLATGEKRVVDKGRIELSAIRRDGAEFPVELAIGSASGSGGAIFISYLRDISARRAAARDLTEARDRALSADRAKSQFIAVMSHEMRTPLNGVLGVLDLLRQTELDERQARFVEVATTSGEILLRHINDVLDITRIEAGKLTLENAPLDLDAVIRGVVEVSRPLAEARGDRLEARAFAAGPPLLGDEHRLRQVLLNLVGNAVKFTRDGLIGIEARMVGETRNAVEVEIAVTDSGVGIAEADRERIFDDFITLDSSYGREASGSGLGLSICRRIVRAMGGEIGVESAKGVGSRFWIRLHLQKDEARPAAETPPPPRSAPAEAEEAPARPARRILVVEDNAVNRMVVREMLELAGYDVAEAVDGLEGVGMAEAARYDLILMDISMPRMDGVAATERIRAGGGPSADARIIGLTAHALPDEQRRFLEAGMDACLIKPIRMSALSAFLGATAHGAEAAGDEDGDDALDAEVLAELAAALPEARLKALIADAIAELETGAAALASLARAPTPDAPAIAAAAHKLAGTAALVGATRLHRALAGIESACKAGEVDSAAATVETLGGAVAATAAILAEFVGEA